MAGEDVNPGDHDEEEGGYGCELEFDIFNETHHRKWYNHAGRYLYTVRVCNFLGCDGITYKISKGEQNVGVEWRAGSGTINF